MEIVAVCTSEVKGVKKTPVPEVEIEVGVGVKGDAHSGPWHRQVSLLAEESIAKMIAKGLDLYPGDFAENLTTRGLNLHGLPVGTHLFVGDAVELEVSQIGKECHTGCAIKQAVGSCIMPVEGIFARVIAGGKVRAGDPIRLGGRE